ncbi:xanthine dehydrogenase family protein molybdopterin-binding subunit [Mesorhizobium sp. B2-5-13]|uniref:xanthine dehydrogenase family protein molybdopterin-binding subunit n=1 Tax=unclassified Mesorhizobium TaxID=325217 RepID=UPI0011262E5A|nr:MULTISPECIES: xanthine dehydrogenase family protein molybdopterin-binding subunit [unclassified Mesorhizobium]TPJ39428.1 xanthine dehydrogenase family protein molybdopterin-binding subunit [Mesorhizobium sp. B2-6-5]TPJ80371.1 xanthine dehydrogenase family protein molybdopterin-binding subunit [Mesorhizobium sp. B2-5-13]TPK45166.1 xanthine dehydrogenase family protein molybdopterin-binding subunit [Mesorhizobium sp. B2-5-5]
MNQAAPVPKENQGQPVVRIDGRLKVTGQASYPADIATANVAYGALATSSIARGKVSKLDTDDARAVPGVLDIITYGDMDQTDTPKFGNTGASSIAPLHDKTIFHDGQIIALVVAETFEAAEEASMLIRADYEDEPPSASFDSKGVKVEPAAGKSPMLQEDVKAGDFDAAYASAAVKIDQKYSTPTQHHNPIELFSTTAMWQGDQLTVHEPSQNVTGWKIELARQLKVDPANVRIVSPYVGGAFGSKGPMTARTAIVAVAARRVGRPVRCVVSRMQAFNTQTYRAETRHRIRIGASKDGRITAFGHEGWEVTSRPDPYVVGGTSATGRMYNYGSVLTHVSVVHADRNTPGYMRSPPETPYVYALENAMDEMAVALGMDPVEFRRINEPEREPIGGKPFSSRSLVKCYDQAAEAFGWSKRNAAVGSMREGDWLVGMGCATAIYPTASAPCAARVRLTADGQVRVQCGSHEIGTGVRTIAGQMAAERLGIGMDKISVEMGDSALPPAPVSGGSISTASVCSAVLKACDAVRAKLFAAAVAGDGPLAGSGNAKLEMEQEKIVASGGKSAKLSDVFKAMQIGAIEEYAEFAPKGSTPEALKKLYAGQAEFHGGDQDKDSVKYAFGAEFVEVRVNSYTREIRVPRVVGAFAAGRIMNTRTARSQLMGGMIWGIGQALHEATEIDRRNARYVNRDLQDYLVPVNADIKQVDVILVPEVDLDVNPAGVKGLGELGNVGTAAAVASAVYHATGKRIRDLPIRIDDLIS